MNTETLARLADTTGDALTRLGERLESGEVDRDTFTAAAVAVLLRAKARGVTLADLALAVELTRLYARLVVPLGLGLPAAAEDDTRNAVTDALDSPQYAVGAAAALTVLGRSQTLDAAQDATHEGMVSHGVDYWTRALNEGACPLCRDLAGEVLPGTTPMYHHKGCGCTQRPVTTPRKDAP